MIPWWTARRRARQELVNELLAHRARAHAVDIELALLRAARDRAEADAAYWKARAERFLDQIGISSAIISAPVMAEPAPAPADHISAAFAALGHDSINTNTPGPPTTEVLGVDPDAARDAVAAFQRSAG